MRRLIRVASIAAVAGGCMVSAAEAAVKPGWECIPTAAGQAVVSGGVATTPSCGAGTTAVLAPTYVAAGVGGKATVQFSTVNVQVVSGSGSTSGTVNGEGNLVVGYAENPSSFPQSGSNDLIVGKGNGWSSFGEIVGGISDQASGSFATVVGHGNVASGSGSFAAGLSDTASGGNSTVVGGSGNKASGPEAVVSGGELNLARDQFASISAGCGNVVRSRR